MIKAKSKSKKSISKSTYKLLGIIALVALVGLYIKSMIVSPQVALIAENTRPVCQTNISSISFHDECATPGTFKRVVYTCINGSTADKMGSLNCISYESVLKEAQNNCGQTCTGPSPVPSCVPHPCAGDGRGCKLMALPAGQVYCPVATTTPYPSISPIASPSPTRTPFPSPTPTPDPSKSFFKITNHPNPVNITCTEGDINCGFYLPVIYQNITSTDLYQATYWTDTPGVKFSNQYGYLTDQKVVLTSPIFFEPGLGPNIIVATKVTTDMKPGVYVRRVYMDAKQCNQIGDVLDCYYGGSAGAITFTINLTVLPKSNPSPSPTPVPTTAPGCYTEQRFCIQSLVGGKCPVTTICPSESPVPKVTPTPTPVPTPVYSTKPSTTPTPATCGTSLNKWQFRESCGTKMYRYIDFNCSGTTQGQVFGNPNICKSEAEWVAEARTTCMNTKCTTPTPTPVMSTSPKPVPTATPTPPNCLRIFGRNICWPTSRR
ncbi:hypothetical protein KBD69_04765 [Candidatus Woesebacteria bacterium]|nr:hypothetical protein [Candidatus Woesebacteria bacterium]